MRAAFKIAYDGVAFHGFARQPNVRTVEGEVLLALGRAGVIDTLKDPRLRGASRTDRGVSALGNVVAFDSIRSAIPAVRAFNGKARGVWAWAVAEVPDDFNVRRARERWYRYLLSPDHDETRLGTAAAIFVGEHDFRNFTKDRSRTSARIDAVSAGRTGDAVVLDFRAPGFRWNLVRRLVAAALEVEAGRATVEDVERALDGPARADFGLAPAESLTLMDVAYDFEFRRVPDPTTVTRIRRLREERTRSFRFSEALSGRFASLARTARNG